MMIDKLLEALTAEFDGDVIFSAWVPSQLTPPQVVVAPGDPYLQPSTHGTVEETWDVLVVVSVKEPGPGIDQMRDLSLRVRGAAMSVGALWRRAGGPRRSTVENSQTVISVNEIAFKYLTEE